MNSNPGVPSQIPKQRVLLVDDSRIVRTTISRLIRKSFDVREEANGEAGWQAITTDPSIVVVFSDLQMPVLDGFALLERIRQSEDPRVRGIPVIVISGDEEDATKKRARAAGANDFITKTTDGTEILSRIDNLLHLVEAKQQLVVNKEALDQTATRDPVTGAFTPHYLATEGGKHYSHARRHGGPLAVLTFRMDSYGEITQKVGKNVADQLLGRIAKLVMGTLRAEDSMGRTAEASFAVIFPGTSSQQALTFARRMHEQLDKAQVTYRDHVLKIRTSIGLAALDVDSASSIEDLMKMALQRLQDAASRKLQRAAKQEEASPLKPVSLPDDLDRAVQAIEHADAQRLGDAASEMLRRMLPFLLAVCRRLNVELPLDKITQALRNHLK
ncbi:MAG: diguanylate cyclase [Betaproteobacteria bacterium]|nr:MAG: diguanylate cyclase [Betaproteobacteria bacterium]